MALSKAFVREVFSGAGADPTKIPEAVDKIVEGNVASIDALREEITDLKTKLKTAEGDSGRLKDVQKELDDLKAQVEADNKAREGKDYDALKDEFDKYKAEVQEKAVKSAKEKAVRGLLSDMNMTDKGTYMFMEYGYPKISVELDEEGKLKDATAIKQVVKKDFGEYIPKIETKGADTKTPPTDGKGGASAKTKEEIMAIKNTTARQHEIAENLELFQ